MLTNDLIRKTILKELGLQRYQVISVKALWNHLCEMGYREDMIKFLDVQANKLPIDNSLGEEFIKQIYKVPSEKEGIGVLETRFNIEEVHLAGEESPLMDELNQYKIEVYGKHYNEKSGNWSSKPTKLFIVKLN